MRVAQAPMDKRCGKALVPALSAARRVGKDKPVAGDFAIATHSHLSQTAGSNPETPMGQIIQLPLSLGGYPDNSAALDPAECILLIAIRWWVDSYRRDEDPLPRLCQGLEAAGTCDAAFTIDALMAIIARTGRQPIAIHCPRCPHVSDDERLLLHAASLTQAGHSHMAEKALCAALLSAQGAEFVNSRLAPCKGWVDSSPKQDSFPSAPIACHGTSTGWGGGTVEPVGAAGNDPLIGE
jgi:hypothetical protein